MIVKRHCRRSVERSPSRRSAACCARKGVGSRSTAPAATRTRPRHCQIRNLYRLGPSRHPGCMADVQRRSRRRASPKQLLNLPRIRRTLRYRVVEVAHDLDLGVGRVSPGSRRSHVLEREDIPGLHILLRATIKLVIRVSAQGRNQPRIARSSYIRMNESYRNCCAGRSKNDSTLLVQVGIRESRIRHILSDGEALRREVDSENIGSYGESRSSCRKRTGALSRYGESRTCPLCRAVTHAHIDVAVTIPIDRAIIPNRDAFVWLRHRVVRAKLDQRIGGCVSQK